MRSKLGAALFMLTLSAGSASAIGGLSVDNHPSVPTELTRRLTDLNAFVRVVTGYTSHELPKVVFRTEDELGRMYYGESYDPKLPMQVQALSSQGVMFLLPNIKLDGSEDYVLVHELTHYQQFESGKTFPCVGAREKEAYEVQAKFVEATGRGVIKDKFTVMALSSCGYY